MEGVRWPTDITTLKQLRGGQGDAASAGFRPSANTLDIAEKVSPSFAGWTLAPWQRVKITLALLRRRPDTGWRWLIA